MPDNTGESTSTPTPVQEVVIDDQTIAAAIVEEVARQEQLWGTDFDDKNTANDWCAYIVRYVSEGAYSGRQDQYSPKKYVEHLMKAAALCVSAVKSILRNGDCAPRHYEGLPRSGAQQESTDGQ